MASPSRLTGLAKPGYPTSLDSLASHGGKKLYTKPKLARLARIENAKIRVYFLLLRGYVDPSQIGPRAIMSGLSRDECHNTILSLAF